MIEHVSFANFKSLRRVDAHLGRFTVLVGPNGSGKTSVLDGLHYLAQTTRRPLASILRGVLSPPSLMTRDADGPMELTLSGRFDDIGTRVRIVITCEPDAEGDPTWSAIVTRRWGKVEEQTSETVEGASALPRAGPKRPPAAPSPPGRKPVEGTRSRQSRDMAALARELGSARKLRLNVEMLAAPSFSHDETPRLELDGRGLASVLADVAGRSPETFQSIQQTARRIIPTLERIRTRRARVEERDQQEIRIDGKPLAHSVDRAYWGQQLVLDFIGAADVPAPLASEGTLLVIGLLTALLTEPRPRLLLLDDIDKALHPRAQGELCAALREVLNADPGLQIVATSHSPYLIDHVEAKDVLITALRPDGSTACAPLTAHPDYERWKRTTRSGELWSFLGEDWIAERTSAEQGQR